MKMKTQDHNECPFSDEIVSYMYGEMPDGAQLKFEHHLAACQVCTDDFAAVSLARFETYDWKRVEFDPLETPQIVIPYREKTVSLGERVSAWLSWVTVVPAAAAIVLSVGVGYFLLVNERQMPGPVAIIPETVQQQSPQTTVNDDAKTVNVISTPNRSANSDGKIVLASSKKKLTLPKTQFAKRVTPGMKLANDLAVNLSAGQIKRAPRLGMNDPEEDRSLRLADLFDETNPPPQR